jgi:Tfp pilus assembly protein PilF
MNPNRIAKLQEFLEKGPNDSFTRYAVAMEYAGHDDAAAIRTLKELIQRDEMYVPAYHQLGILYARMSRADDASAILRKGISVARTLGDHHAAEEMQEVIEELNEE